MAGKAKELSVRSVAVIAGIGLLLTAIAAGFSYGYVLSRIVFPADAAKTFEAVKANMAFFRAGIFG